MESDKALVERISRRDPQAFDVLMRRYVGQVRVHLLRIVRDEAAADDLAQDVSLRVWERASQWDGRGSFKAWLMRVATNLALNHLRSKRRKREQPLVLEDRSNEEDEESLAPGWMIDNSTLGPAEVVELAEQKELLRGLVDALPEGKRQVLQMVHEHDMDLTEVAETLGIPVGTVKSRLHYTFRWLGRNWPDVQNEQEDSQ